VVKAELLYGACKSNAPDRSRKKVFQFILPFEIVSFDSDAANAYANIRAQLEKRGEPIGANDLIIAATALSRNGRLITHNVSEFGRIRGLEVEDWCEA
jgi:tRNA(fMet)-specific endonuclease VapC